MQRSFLALTCLFLATAWSQEFRATITGRVIDSQGAVVPNTTITATLVTTGARSETTSGADGLYTIPFLPPGSYRLEARHDGFKRYVRSDIEVNTGERLALDIQL